MVSTNNGILFMLTNGQQIQRKEKWIKSGDSLLKDHSISLLKWAAIDILTKLIVTLLLSRPQMDKNHKSGTLTRQRKLSSYWINQVILLQLEIMVMEKISNHNPLKHNGSNNSCSKMVILQMLRMETSLKLMEPKMLKQWDVALKPRKQERTKDGELSMLIQFQIRLRDWIKILVSLSIDLSILDQDFQCTELQSAQAPTLTSRDGERMILHNSGSSTLPQRL